MRKEPLILIPGLLSDAEVWRHQVQYLSNLTEIRVPDISKGDTLEDLIGSIMIRAPRRFALGGHSMGGWLAIEMVRCFPDRVTKLCLLATTADRDSEGEIEIRKAMVDQAQNNNYKEIIQRLIRSFVFQESAKKAVKEMFRRNTASFITHQKIMMERRSSIPFLRKIKQPTLVIVGTKDRYFYDKTIKISSKIPGSKLATIDDCGHMLTVEMPYAVTAFMRYWLNHF